MLNIEQLERRIAEEMAAWRIPGLALAVVASGEIIYTRGFGVTSVEAGGVPVTADTLFRIGSISKPLTATLALRLAERGLLDLDAPITRYLPWLALRDGDLGSVTPRHLLSMASGLVEGPYARSTPNVHRRFDGYDRRDLAAHVREDFPQQRAVAPPGLVWWYNTGGTNLVGHLAEVVAGVPFARLMRDMVFAPLGMARSLYELSEAITYPVALAHALDADGTLSVQRPQPDYPWLQPGAFAFSTAHDLARFAAMQVRGGVGAAGSFLSPTSLAAMHAPHADLRLASGMRYGLHLFLDEYKGVRRVGHDGVFMSCRNKMVMAPDAGAAVVVLHTRGEEWRERREAMLDGIFDAVLGLPESESASLASLPRSAEWRGREGTYWDVEDGRTLTVRDAGDTPVVEANGATVQLHPVAPGVYAGENRAETGIGSQPYIPAPTLSIGFAGASPALLTANGKLFARAKSADNSSSYL